MVNCSSCGIHVNSVLLRLASPKCENGHDLGAWVRCSEGHVFLSKNSEKCTTCGRSELIPVEEGVRVKCNYVNSSGNACTTRPFIWIKEGPPCFMNHVGNMILVSS